MIFSTSSTKPEEATTEEEYYETLDAERTLTQDVEKLYRMSHHPSASAKEFAIVNLNQYGGDKIAGYDDGEHY